ncbi:hypothetical protein GA0115253_109491, partial [Streptomyces sp. Termitarium-T10T-6]
IGAAVAREEAEPRSTAARSRAVRDTAVRPTTPSTSGVLARCPSSPSSRRVRAPNCSPTTSRPWSAARPWTRRARPPASDWLDGPALLVGGERRADLAAPVLSLVEDGDPDPLLNWLAEVGVRSDKPVRLV